MKSVKISLFCLFLSPFLSMAQANKFYYRTSTEIKNEITDKKISWERAAIYYQLIGNYQEAMKIWAANDQVRPISKSDSLAHFSNLFSFVDAKKYIVERSLSEQILIFNEAHHYPRHRVFVESMLQELFNNGYKSIGFETLSLAAPNITQDTNLNQRKYPIIETGYYSSEPRYGNLIRTALKIGFKVFPYDPLTCNGDFQCREKGEAENIKAHIDKYPNEKIIVYCGYGHASEYFDEEYTMMAGWLKKLTGINPFTIDQTTLRETSIDSLNHPVFNNTTIKEPAIIVFENGNALYGNDMYDCQVYQSKTNFINDRPDWLYDKSHLAYNIDKKLKKLDISYPILLKAYFSNEYQANLPNEKKPIPVDIIELQSKNDSKKLILSKGNYIVEVSDFSKKMTLIPLKIK